jgi:hypothetical protein
MNKRKRKTKKFTLQKEYKKKKEKIALQEILVLLTESFEGFRPSIIY